MNGRNWRLCALVFSVSLGMVDAAEDLDFGSRLKSIPVGWGMVDVGANARLRYEFFTNRSLKQYATGDNDDVLYDRVGIWGRYRTPVGFQLTAEMYGAHMWLNEFSPHDFTPACGHQNTLDIRRLYLSMKSIAESGIGFRVGRQSLAYGDQRIWGPGNWSNSGKFIWDAAVLTYKAAGAEVDLIYGRRVITKAYELDYDHYEFHAGGIYIVPGISPIAIHFFGVGMHEGTGKVAGESGAGDMTVATLGAYTTGKVGAFGYDATLAGQGGAYGGDKVLAGAGHLGADYTFETALSPRVSAGYTYATGDPDPSDGVRNTFDGVFGAAAKYYGRMNMFFWKNLSNVEAGIGIAPFRKTDFSIAYHYFALAHPKDAWYRTNGKPQKCGKIVMRDISGKSGRELGHEIDLIFSTGFLPGTKLQAGYSHLFAGEFMRSMLWNSRSHDLDWVFAQLQYTL